MRRLGSAAQRAICVLVGNLQEIHVKLIHGFGRELLQDLSLQDRCRVDVPNTIWPYNRLVQHISPPTFGRRLSGRRCSTLAEEAGTGDSHRCRNLVNHVDFMAFYVQQQKGRPSTWK